MSSLFILDGCDISDKLLSKNYAPLHIDLHGATWTDENEYIIRRDGKRFEMWEKPYALVIGLMTAFKYANEVGINNIQKYNTTLRDRLNNNLSSIQDVQCFDRGTMHSNIITFQKAGCLLSKIEEHLDKHNVYYSVTKKDGALIDFTKKKIDWAVRLSPHYFNTIEEMDKLSEIIDEI